MNTNETTPAPEPAATNEPQAALGIRLIISQALKRLAEMTDEDISKLKPDVAVKMLLEGAKLQAGIEVKTAPPKPRKRQPKRSDFDGWGLNLKQRKFVQNFVVSGNAREAYRKAGYEGTSGADASASGVLSNPKVQAAIENISAKRERRLAVKVDNLCREYARIGFADITDILEYDGETVRIKPTSEWGEDAAHAVKSIIQTQNGVQVHMHSKTAALDSLGKHLGMFIQRVVIENGNEARKQFNEILTKDPEAVEALSLLSRRMAGLTLDADGRIQFDPALAAKPVESVAAEATEANGQCPPTGPQQP